MSAQLLFPDPSTASDVLTFADRAARLGDGAVRLRAVQGTLGLTSAPLAPQTLLESTPTVLGMRFVRVDPELECDLVVDAASLAIGDDERSVLLPDSAVSAPWAGVSPPRGGWTQASSVDAATLASRAQWGIAAVAEAVPASAGEDVVRLVRAQVWGEPDAELADLPRGVAFAAFALGFVAGAETAVVRRSGPWTRITLQRGHVLTRTRVHTGLTEVRATGAL
ncbi:hypothetical protein [Microbacterium hominis]|uniref:Uncharacterized protein n=1 Tax=Microbacterium hominis TaxID=162426 RepID=A0A0B4CI16_9MICO|nr:hypothetical protein [Microbacterium hominis]KIC56112.1 hypothetical protein RM52_13320 [Microbacterium hominis]